MKVNKNDDNELLIWLCYAFADKDFHLLKNKIFEKSSLRGESY